MASPRSVTMSSPSSTRSKYSSGRTPQRSRGSVVDAAPPYEMRDTVSREVSVGEASRVANKLRSVDCTPEDAAAVFARISNSVGSREVLVALVEAEIPSCIALWLRQSRRRPGAWDNVCRAALGAATRCIGSRDGPSTWLVPAFEAAVVSEAAGVLGSTSSSGVSRRAAARLLRVAVRTPLPETGDILEAAEALARVAQTPDDDDETRREALLGLGGAMRGLAMAGRDVDMRTLTQVAVGASGGLVPLSMSDRLEAAIRACAAVNKLSGKRSNLALCRARVRSRLQAIVDAPPGKVSSASRSKAKSLLSSIESRASHDTTSNPTSNPTPPTPEKHESSTSSSSSSLKSSSKKEVTITKRTTTVIASSSSPPSSPILSSSAPPEPSVLKDDEHLEQKHDEVLSPHYAPVSDSEASFWKARALQAEARCERLESQLATISRERDALRSKLDSAKEAIMHIEL